MCATQIRVQGGHLGWNLKEYRDKQCGSAAIWTSQEEISRLGGIRERPSRQNGASGPRNRRKTRQDADAQWARGGTVAEGLRVTGRIISQASFGTNDSGFQAVAYIQANKEKQFAYEVAARTRCLETLSTVIALSFTNYANLTEWTSLMDLIFLPWEDRNLYCQDAIIAFKN